MRARGVKRGRYPQTRAFRECYGVPGSRSNLEDRVGIVRTASQHRQRGRHLRSPHSQICRQSSGGSSETKAWTTVAISSTPRPIAWIQSGRLWPKDSKLSLPQRRLLERPWLDQAIGHRNPSLSELRWTDHFLHRLNPAQLLPKGFAHQAHRNHGRYYCASQ